MLVRFFMTRTVSTLPAELTCAQAWDKFRKEKLRRAPVVREGQVIGMLTDRDLMGILPTTIGDIDQSGDRLLREKTVGEIVPSKLVSVEPNDHIETAAQRMLEFRIGGLPVLHNGKLEGIITESDLFRIFGNRKHATDTVRLTLHWPGGQDEAPDPGRLALVTGSYLHEFFAHPSPSGGDLFSLRVAGNRIDEFVSRLLTTGYLLIDRADPPVGSQS